MKRLLILTAALFTAACASTPKPTPEAEICPLSADKAVANIKFARLGKDGNPMAPGERMVSFDLTKFADGWRATKLTGGDASKPLACPVM